MTRLFVSAAAKSSGKTTITLGLAAALHARGVKVQTFKKGPDYIDPMWLARASGRASYNLDFNTQSPDEMRALYARAYGDADIALIEGNKGLHDGVDPHGADSSAALAKLLRAPAVLIIDAHGMARGIAPLLLGYRDFDRDVQFAGVILNKVGGARQEGKLRQAIENYTDFRVLGALGRDHGLNIDERHLGLTTPSETGECDEVIAQARDAVSKGVDLDALLAAAAREEPQPTRALRALPAPDVTLAVARDAAFGFYYADDLEALEEAGARLVFVDMLRDAALPACDGLFIGGGFPETQSRALAANRSMRESVRAAVEDGLPTYAECGGLMYLTRSISYRGEAEGSAQEMVGVIPAEFGHGRAAPGARAGAGRAHGRLPLAGGGGRTGRRPRISLRAAGKCRAGPALWLARATGLRRGRPARRDRDKKSFRQFHPSARDLSRPLDRSIRRFRQAKAQAPGHPVRRHGGQRADAAAGQLTNRTEANP